MKTNRFSLHSTFYILHSRRGFTLMETVIYIGLFSIITSFVMVVFYQIIGGQNQHRNRVEVDSEANFMMQKMIWAIMGATAINQPALNTTSATLSVTKYNYAENPVVFDVGSRNLRITKASGTPVLLGSNRVYVNQLIFEHLPQVQSAPEAVKITMQVVTSDIERPVTASTTLVNTIYLRK